MTDYNPPNDDSQLPDSIADPIAKAWADQSETPAHELASAQALSNTVAAAHRKDQRLLLWLNIREVLPILAMAGIFLSLVSESVYPVSTAAASVVALSVGLFMAGSSLRHHRADSQWGDSIREQLARRLEQLKHRAWLYQNLAWWYFLPLGLSIVLFWFGYSEDPTISDGLFFFGVSLVALLVTYRINRKIGHKKYDAEIERLEPLLAEFDLAV